MTNSNIRQVPDNQEVYLDNAGFSSIVFDILERVEKGNDLEALKFHLADIVEEDRGEVRVWGSQEVKLGKMP